MAVGEDVVGTDGLTNRERFEMRRERKRKEAEARAAREAAAREAAIAAARAEAEAAAAAGGGMLSTPPPEPTDEEISGFKRYHDLLASGTIDEQGNILKPDGINMTEIMRGDPPSWATPELIKNAYIHAFESKARGGQDFMESGDYQNFLNAGYSLTEDQISSIGGVQGQGNQDDLVFGPESQPTTGVANPPPPATEPPASGPTDPAAPVDPTAPAEPPPTWGEGDWTERENTYTRTDGGFMSGYANAQANQPAGPTGPAPVASQKTPFADAYFRAMEAAKKKGPVSSMFAGMIPGE